MGQIPIGVFPCWTFRTFELFTDRIAYGFFRLKRNELAKKNRSCLKKYAVSFDCFRRAVSKRPRRNLSGDKRRAQCIPLDPILVTVKLYTFSHSVSKTKKAANTTQQKGKDKKGSRAHSSWELNSTPQPFRAGNIAWSGDCQMLREIVFALSSVGRCIRGTGRCEAEKPRKNNAENKINRL